MTAEVKDVLILFKNLFNLIALFALSGIVGKETKAYFAEKNHDLKELSKSRK